MRLDAFTAGAMRRCSRCGCRDRHHEFVVGDFSIIDAPANLTLEQWLSQSIMSAAARELSRGGWNWRP